MICQRGDVEVIFFTHHDGVKECEFVEIQIAGARACTVLSLEHFCELMADCKKEIQLRHWGSGKGGAANIAS